MHVYILHTCKNPSLGIYLPPPPLFLLLQTIFKPRHCNHYSSKNVAAVTRLTTCDNILVSTYSFERRQSEEKKQRERERVGKKEENYFWDVKGKSKHLLSETVKGWFNLGLHMDMQEAQLSFLFLLSIIYQMSSWATVELLHMHTEIITRSAAKLRN